MTRNGSIWMLTAALAFTGLATPARAQQVSEARIRELIRQAADRVAHGGLDASQQATTAGQTRPKVAITLDEAYNGASVDVPTFDGTVVLKIPPRSQNHARLRLRGKGIERKATRGDFFVELDVRMPDQADDALAEALRASKDAYGKPVREGLAL